MRSDLTVSYTVLEVFGVFRALVSVHHNHVTLHFLMFVVTGGILHCAPYQHPNVRNRFARTINRGVCAKIL